MDAVNIDNKRERHWRNFSGDNEGGVDDKKALLHTKRWDLYLNKKKSLVKCKYSVEVVRHDKKKVLWGVVGDHVVEEPSDHEDIGLKGFDFNILDEDEEGVVREGCSEPYLKFSIKLWPGDWIDQLMRINRKFDEGKGKQLNKGNVRYRKVHRFSSNELWNLYCIRITRSIYISTSSTVYFLIVR